LFWVQTNGGERIIEWISLRQLSKRGTQNGGSSSIERRAMDLYRLSAQWPDAERYNLTAQLRKAAT
jgi:hypothetical protein